MFKKLSFIASAAGLILLTGCQQMQRQVANKELKNDVEICKNGKELSPDNVIERMDCINMARRKWAAKIGANDEWVLERELSENRATAMKYASGKIDKEEYKLEVQQNHADAAQADSEFMERQRDRALQAWGMMQPQQQVQPYVMLPQQVIHTNCMGVGYGINCTSYR